MIILGLGPAGAYLGHRATARGLKVLGIDPAERWHATYGGWVAGLADAPLHWRGFPSVRFGGLGYQLTREYGIIDNERWRAQLLDFEVIQRTAEVISAHKVRVGEQDFLADVVIDARGTMPVPPLQQALGWFVDDGPTAWMNWDGDTFLYSFPTASGHLLEETVLATTEIHPWEELEAQLRKRFPGAQPRATEKVLISLTGRDWPGPALAFGARAGFVNPITGYSLETSISMAEPTLDALWVGGQLPWRTARFRADRALSLRLQRVLLRLEAAQVHEIMRALLLSPFYVRFLSLGDFQGTLRGMAWVFARVSLRTKLAILRALGPLQ